MTVLHVTLLALPSSAAGVLNAPLPPGVSKNPPEACVPALEVKLAEDHTPAFCDQSENVASPQGARATEQRDGSSFSATPVLEPGSTADSAEASAGLSAHKVSAFSAEDPVASLGLHAVVSQDESNHSFVAAKKLTCQEVELISVDAKAPAGESPGPKPLTPEDVCADHKDGFTSELSKASVGAAEDKILLDDLASKNENLDEAFRSEKTKCDAPLTAFHLSGWFYVLKPSSSYFL